MAGPPFDEIPRYNTIITKQYLQMKEVNKSVHIINIIKEESTNLGNCRFLALLTSLVIFTLVTMTQAGSRSCVP